MAFALPPRSRIRACVYAQKLFCVLTLVWMRSVCGPSSSSKHIIALKYNPSSLQLTASNLKESSVGKIICQGRIESSRLGTHLFIPTACITMRTNRAPLLLHSQRTHGAFDRGAAFVFFFCLLEDTLSGTSVKPVKDKQMASSHGPPLQRTTAHFHNVMFVDVTIIMTVLTMWC